MRPTKALAAADGAVALRLLVAELARAVGLARLLAPKTVPGAWATACISI